MTSGKMVAAVLSSGEEQSYNFDDSDAESEKVRKAKKSKKLGHDKWSGSLICKRIDEHEAPLSHLSFVSTPSSFLVCGGPAALRQSHPTLNLLKLWQKLLFSADIDPP